MSGWRKINGHSVYIRNRRPFSKKLRQPDTIPVNPFPNRNPRRLSFASYPRKLPGKPPNDPPLSPDYNKDWREKGFKKQIFTIPNTNYAVDVVNEDGKANFGFTVRNGSREVFSIPSSLLKSALRCGLAIHGIPDIGMELPLGLIQNIINGTYNF